MCRTQVAVLLAVGMLAGACSRSAVVDDAGISSPGEAAPAELAFGDDGPDGVRSSEPLRLALVKPDSWDPAMLAATDQNAVILADLFYDGLTEASAAGTLRPALAVSWEPNADYTTWTFELDLERVTPPEVVASFNRLRQQGTASTAVQLLDEIESIEAVGDAAVEFRSRNPYAGLPWVLSGIQYSVVVDDELTGVYDLASEGEAGFSLTGEGYRPISVAWGESGSEAYEKLTLAQVGAAVVPPELARDAAIRFGQQVSARSIVRFYGLNLASERLWDPRIREAVLASADRPGMLTQLPSAGFSSDGVAAPSTAGFTYGACNGACLYDPNGARGLLTDAALWPNLTLAYVGESQREVATVLARSLRDVGFGTTVEEVSADELAARIEDGSVDLFSFGWTAPAGSMDAVVPPLFASYSSLNVTRLVSPEVDQLLAQAAATGDDSARWALLADAERVALNLWVLIPLAVAQNGLVQSPDVDPLPLRADGSIDVGAL